MAVLPDGKILVTGYNRTIGANPTGNPTHNADIYRYRDVSIVLRLLPNGGIDFSYGSNGYTTFEGTSNAGTEHTRSVTSYPDGSVLLATTVSQWYDNNFFVRLTKLRPDGTGDTSFNNGLNFRIGFVYRSIHDSKVDSEGRILLFGANRADYGKTFITRIFPNGILDTSFNGTGEKESPCPMGPTTQLPVRLGLGLRSIPKGGSLF